jgi:tetratricopeptide (TPR) repeat protein
MNIFPGLLRIIFLVLFSSLVCAAKAGTDELPGYPHIAHKSKAVRAPEPGLTAEAYIRRGKEYFHQQDFPEAIKNYELAVQIDPGNYKAYNYLGYAYFQEGLLSQANENLSKSVSLNPSYALAHYNLALVNWAYGYKNRGVKELKRSLELDPYYADAVQKDPQFTDILASPSYQKYKDTASTRIPLDEEPRLSPKPPPKIPEKPFDWGKVGIVSLDIASFTGLSLEMWDDHNQVLMVSSDLFLVGGLIGYASTRPDPNHPSFFSLVGGLGAISLMGYPLISTVDGFLIGNNPKGTRGLLGLAADAVILTNIGLKNERQSAFLFPKVNKDSVQLVFMQRF